MISAAVLASATLLASTAAQAVESDRLAVEQLPGESPTEAGLAFADACYRLGVTPAAVRPVQTFTYDGKPFVRLDVVGPPLVLRCLNGLAGRRAVDGTIQWFDGFAGGEVLPATGKPERLADARWYRPEATLPAVKPDEALVDQLAQGSAEARTALGRRPVDEALADVAMLATRGGPGGLAALEVIARTDPHAPVRRAAVDVLDPILSAPVILEAARHDPAWQVRLGAVGRLGLLAGMKDSPRAPEASDLLVRVLQSDPDWTVQRAALWLLTTRLLQRRAGDLRPMLTNPAVDRRVRASLLEAFGSAGLATHDELVRFIRSDAPELRAIAAELLAAHVTPADAPLLWTALHDRERLVRLAAAPFLSSIDDDTVAFALWPMYQVEASHVDADEDFELIVLDALARHPSPGLPALMVQRLQRADLSPDERRLLSRTLTRLAPEQAARLFEPELRSADPLVRSIAADAAPDTPAIHARRLALLRDDNADVRAGAFIGLCRSTTAPMGETLAEADLDPTPLAQEAALMAARCGQKPPEVHRFRTALAGPHGGSQPDESDPGWAPGTAAIALLLLSVLANRLWRKPDGDAATAKA